MKHYIFILMALVCMASCSSESDYVAPDTPDTPDTPAEQIAKKCSFTNLNQSSVAKGFPVVIIADGYTQAEIDNGTYKSALDKATVSLFSMEPMKSLKQYVDVIGVIVPSNESGINSSKHDTALGTYMPSADNVTISGDVDTIFTCAARAIMNRYNMSVAEINASQLSDVLTIVLVNSSAYKGISLLNYVNTVKDSIPQGYSISYVPVNATYVNGTYHRAVFTELIQHEGVGHGIGKLGDEYVNYTNMGSIPSPKAITEFKNEQKYGMYMNVQYDANANTQYNHETPEAGGTSAITSSSWLYPYTQRAEYSADNMQWYTGAFTFPTRFCRSSVYSTMNATPDTHNKYFNVISRAMIYKRIMRVAMGSTWKFNMDGFVAFDAAARTEIANDQTASAKGTFRSSSVAASSQGADVQALATPRILDMSNFRLHE